jgi:hypothetical protein
LALPIKENPPPAHVCSEGELLLLRKEKSLLGFAAREGIVVIVWSKEVDVVVTLVV